MVKLYNGGVWLVNGTEIIEENQAGAVMQRTGKEAVKEDARKGTMAYSILEKHNTSDNMKKLKIRFDAMTSHDITFVGIVQTAKASGMEKFPVPYVLTNCHNSLCAVGGTINEDDHAACRPPKNMAVSMFLRILQSSTNICGKQWQAAAR